MRTSRCLHSLAVVLLFCSAASAAIVHAIDRAEPKMVKIHGAGGFRGMASYQTGILISPEGHVLTVFSHVLDTDYITAVLNDGRKFEAKLLGADPKLEVAVLKIDAAGLPHYDLDKTVTLDAGARILALSNIFGTAAGNEPVSVQRGTVSVLTRLEARRGAYDTPYQGPVYILDVVTNNSGAAGGALVDLRGELAGMLGKELRNSLNDTWLNYALPIAELRQSVADIRAGKFVVPAEEQTPKKPLHSLDLNTLGIVLIPDVMERTPPYVDHVRPDSPAASAGVRPDDLIVLMNDRLVRSCKNLESELAGVDREDPVSLTVLRGQNLLVFSLQSNANSTKEGQP